MKSRLAVWAALAVALLVACSPGEDDAQSAGSSADATIGLPGDPFAGADATGGTAATDDPSPPDDTTPDGTDGSAPVGPSSPATGEPAGSTVDSAAVGSSAPPEEGGDRSLRFDRVDAAALEPARRGGRFTTLDVLGGVFVIGGDEVGDDGAARPMVWRSLDGSSWVADDLPAATSARVTAAVVVADRLLVFGAGTDGDDPLAWSVSAGGEVEQLAAPGGPRARWTVTDAQQYGDGALLWGRATGAGSSSTPFALVSDDGVTWRRESRLDRLLAGHAAREVLDVASGAAGSAAVLATASGDSLVLVNEGAGWLAWVLDAPATEVAGVDVADEIRLAGATGGGSDAEPAVFTRRRGEWRARRADIVPDDRNAGFQSSTGNRLHDVFIGGQIVTGDVATAEVLAVAAGGTTWIEAAYPDRVSGPGQPPIAAVVRSGDATVAIAADRPALVRVDGFAVSEVASGAFPGGSTLPSASGLVADGGGVAFRGSYESVPAAAGARRRDWAYWSLDAAGRVDVTRSDDALRLELADLAALGDGALVGVGYEDFVPANFADFIQPYWWEADTGVLRPRPAGGHDRTVRFHQVSDAGTSVVAVGTVFDDAGRLDPVFFQRGGAGADAWTLTPAPEPDDAEVAASVSLVELCPLPGAGAVLFATYPGADDQNRTFVTGDGASWQRYAPAELDGSRATVRGCAPAADHVLVFGTLDGRAQLWRTVDGQRFEPVAAPDARSITDAAVDEGGDIWLLTAGDRVVQLGPDGTRRAVSRVTAADPSAPVGDARPAEIAVTPRQVVLLGSFNGGIGLWAADR